MGNSFLIDDVIGDDERFLIKNYELGITNDTVLIYKKVGDLFTQTINETKSGIFTDNK